MPSRKKKYNARFPAGRIKKIMQSDEEIGKVAKAVPVIISKTLELFVESLLKKTIKVTNSRNYKTLSPSHLKQCIMSEQKFDFLRELVKNVPDISSAESDSNYQDDDAVLTSSDDYQDSDTPSDLSKPSTSLASYQQNKVTISRNLSLQQNSTNGSNEKAATPSELRRSYSQNGYMTASKHSTNFEQTPSTSHLVLNSNNFGTSTSSYSKQDSDVSRRLQQRIESKSVTATVTTRTFNNTTSVIKHTKSIGEATSSGTSCDQIPNKIARSDSHSDVLFSKETKNCVQNIDNNHDDKIYLNNAAAAATATAASAIPSPILSFDFSNKPVVQLDYSQLTLPSTNKVISNEQSFDTYSASTSGSGSLSSKTSSSIGPTQTSKSNFDLNSPVINIDLSNLVPPSNFSNNLNSSSKKASEVKTPSGAIATISATAAAVMPIATISIGSMPPSSTPALIPTKLKVENNSRFSSDSAATAASSTLPSGSKGFILSTKMSSSLDLDEDYDDL